MSDSDAYSYEYDEDDANSASQSFQYTDDDEEGNNDNDEAVNIENCYYNAKAARDNGDIEEAREGLENVVKMEVEMGRGGDGEFFFCMERDFLMLLIRWVMELSVPYSRSFCRDFLIHTRS